MKIALVIGIIFLTNCPLNAMQFNDQDDLFQDLFISEDYYAAKPIRDLLQKIFSTKEPSKFHVLQLIEYLFGVNGQAINGGFDEYDLVAQYHAEDK